VKKDLQQRHLRRLGLELIVRQTGRKRNHPINQKQSGKKRKNEEGRKVSAQNLEEKSEGRRHNFKSAVFPYYHSAADNWRGDQFPI
jgi:hypothetical protein